MEQSEDLVTFLKSKLGTKGHTEVKMDFSWNDFVFDMMIKDESKTYLMQVRRKANLDALAQINLYKDFIGRYSELNSQPRFVLVTKSMPNRLVEMAKMLDIEVVHVPHDMRLSTEADIDKQTVIKITSEKSWRVISGLIRSKTSSIRNLSITEEVSYGWAHSTITSLIMHGIAKRSGNMVSLSDMDKLLNGVAWERPTGSLVVKELYLPKDDVFAAARELSEALRAQDIPHAFTSYMAGTQYTGHSVRYDSLQLYVIKEKINILKELMDTSSKGGLRLQIMAPDRELFKDVRVMDGISIASPSQTLLDLAGLGYKGKDLTKALVAIYDKL